MKGLIYSLMLVALMSSAAFAGHSGNNVSFGISFNQPAYRPVYVYPQPVYTCPTPVYFYPAPAYSYVPSQSWYSIGFSTFWGNGGGREYSGRRGHDDNRGNSGSWHGRR